MITGSLYVSACPQYTPPVPPAGCTIVSWNGADGCPALGFKCTGKDSGMKNTHTGIRKVRIGITKLILALGNLILASEKLTWPLEKSHWQ